MLSSRERTSVIVIRVWRELDHADRLRARITAVRDLEAEAVETEVAADVDEIMRIVQRLVAEFTKD